MWSYGYTNNDITQALSHTTWILNARSSEGVTFDFDREVKYIAHSTFVI